MAWALFCHDFDLSKGINILSEKCPVVLDHYSHCLCIGRVYLLVFRRERHSLIGGLRFVGQFWHHHHRHHGHGVVSAAPQPQRLVRPEHVGIEHRAHQNGVSQTNTTKRPVNLA